MKSLLQSNQTSAVQNKTLIEEVGQEPQSNTGNVEEMSLMEMMMQAQAEAKKEQEKEKKVEVEKQTKSFGTGFKKGFFGNSNEKSNSAKKSSQPSKKTATTGSTMITSNEITTITPKSEKGIVIDEVQNAMNESNPVLKNLQKGGINILTNNATYYE